VERKWDWWGPEGWVGMVSLGGNRWKGLCTEVDNPERGWVAEEVGLEHGRWGDNSRNPEVGELSAWGECSGVGMP